jgi:hypothetical protein
MMNAKNLVTAALTAGAMLGLTALANAQQLTVGTVTGNCGQQVIVPITVSGASNIDAFGMDITFSNSCVTYVRTEAGTATADWGTIGGNLLSPGVVRVGGAKFSGTAVNGSGQILRLVLQCGAGACGCVTNLTVSNRVDDLASATVTNGQVTCATASAGTVQKIREYNFDGGMDQGWLFFAGSAPTFSAPSNLSAPGYLLIAAQNNTNTYGFFVSSGNGLTMIDFDPMADGTQTGALHERQGPHYLVRYHVRRTTADRTKAPVMRLRANSANFETYNILTVSSVPTFDSVPNIFTNSAMDLFFQPHPLMYSLPAGQRTYAVAFDIIGFDGSDDANGGYLIDKVEIFAVPLPKVVKVADVKEYNFAAAAQFDDWDQLQSSFTDIGFSTAVGTGLIMNAPNPDNAFGNWQSKFGAISPNATGQAGQLFVKLRYLVGANEPSGRKVPQMRFRAAPANFTSVAETGVVDTDTFTFVPRQGNDRIFHTYLKVPTGAGSFPIIAAWDLLSFESFANQADRDLNATSPQNVILRNLKVELVRVDDYPAVN